jgi:hypothetical protein
MQRANGQSYGGVEGDSASSAELYALMSALGDIPLRQDLAVTGSVNQRGVDDGAGRKRRRARHSGTTRTVRSHAATSCTPRRASVGHAPPTGWPADSISTTSPDADPSVVLIRLNLRVGRRKDARERD